MSGFIKCLFIAFLALISAETLVFADSVTVTLAGVGPVNDGVDYVLPYVLTIDGQGPYDADCYDYFDNVNLGQSWQANELKLNQAAASGAFQRDYRARRGKQCAGRLRRGSVVVRSRRADPAVAGGLAAHHLERVRPGSVCGNDRHAADPR